MNCRLVGQSYRLPFLPAVFTRDQIMHAATVDRVVGIPARAGSQFGLTIAIDVRRGDAHVVELSELFGNDVFLPTRILVPNNHVFIGKDNVRFFVPVYVRKGNAVTDADVGIDIDRTKNGHGRIGGKAGQGKEAESG